MKVGVYTYDADGDTALLTEMVRGAGHRPLPRNAAFFREDQMEPFHAVVLHGMRQGSGRAAAAYAAKGIPVFIYDLGYIGRPDYFQLGIGALNWLPPEPCPEDRRIEQGLVLRQRKGKGDYFLFCGQAGGDAAHGLEDEELLGVYAQAASQLKELCPARKIVWRPHPKQPHARMPYADEVQDPAVVRLEKAIQHAFAVYSYNSTSALPALLRGVPVLCNAGAMYADLAYKGDLDATKYEPPAAADVEAFFNRVACAQWTKDELRSGEPFARLLELAQ